MPGVSGGGLGTDFLLNGIAISGLTLDGNGNAGIAGDGDRAIVYAASEDPLVQAGNATNIFGLGAGVLQPGFGVGKAFDTIKITDGSVITTSFTGPLASVLLNTGSFVQSGPANSTQQAALIVNGGDEVGVQGNNIADSITATLSTNFNIQINGNLPGLTFVNLADKLSPRQGDQLVLNLPANALSKLRFAHRCAARRAGADGVVRRPGALPGCGRRSLDDIEHQRRRHGDLLRR